MNVSPNFALPLKIVAPYFIIAAMFYLFSMTLLFFISFNSDMRDLSVIAWSHAYMIGFVMMSIIGAMAQLSVVVAEVYHIYPRAFVATFISLLVGIIIIIYGFLFDTTFISIGGSIILFGLFVYIYNLYISVAKSKRKSAVVSSMRFSTLFLAIGLFIGIVMALGYGGVVEIDPSRIAPAHILSIFGGYVMLNIMSVSTVLLPMFGACSRPSDMAHKISFYMMIASVVTMIASAISMIDILAHVSYLLAFLSVLYYMIQVFKIFTSKKRKYSDIWERYVAISFISLVISMICIVAFVINRNDIFLKLAFFILMVGFLGFLIVAHLYKIVPFLVWFERFAPYIEERAVPSLYELLPSKTATSQWYISVIALLLMVVGFIIEAQMVWKIGTILAIFSAVMLLLGLYQILSRKLEL